MKSLSLPIYNLQGQEVGSFDLDATVFGVTPNQTLLHQAIVRSLANRRATTAHTKDRSEVAGGGRKPWRQKGTGNARAGSIRSPLWRGGGITFGPRSDRNYTLRMPQKMRQAALKAALSLKVGENNLIIVDSLESLDGKTKTWVTTATQLPQKTGKTLVVSALKNDLVDRSIRNTSDHKYVGLAGLTLFDTMRFPVMIIDKSAIETLVQSLQPKAAKEAK